MINPELSSNLKTAYGVDIAADLKSHPEWTPRVTQQIIDEAGARYTYLEISYLAGDEVQATRNVAKILPGNHTEIAYWTEAAPTKSLTVHWGNGRLIIGEPNGGAVQEISINHRDTEKVILPPGRFYTIQAEVNGIEPLVISGFYQPPPDWEGLEISVEPGKDYVQAKDGIKKIPNGFNAMLNI